MEYFGERAVVRPNDTGLHVVVSLRGAQDAPRLCEQARQAGIHVVPLSSYQMSKHSEATADFYFSSAGISEQDIIPAIQQLSRIWR